MMMIRRTPLFAAALIAAAAAIPASAQEQREFTIGATAPLTGPAANSGQAHREGYQLAVDEWNADQGDYVTDNPPQVRLIVEDQNAKPEAAVSAAQRMITSDNIDMLVGDSLYSHVTMALMELAPQYNLPILSAEPVSSAIADKVRADPERYKLYWKGNWNSDGYGQAVYDFYKWAFANGVIPEGNKKIAFVVEDTDYGIANAEKIGGLFKGDGWTVTAEERMPIGTTDFYPQLSKIRGDEPAVIVSVFTAPNSGISFVRQLKEQGLEGSHLAIYYPTKPEFMEAAADTAEGMYWATLQFAPELVPEHKAFADKVEAKFGQPGTYSHAHAYCVMRIALRALDAAGDKGSEAIANEVSKADYPCVYGRWTFDPQDHAARWGAEHLPIPVAQIQGGKSQIVWPETVATAKPQQ